MLPSELTGEWEGEIKTYEGTIPIQLTIEENGDVWMKFLNDPHSEGKGKKPESFWPAQFENGIFSASFGYCYCTHYCRCCADMEEEKTKIRFSISIFASSKSPAISNNF